MKKCIKCGCEKRIEEFVFRKETNRYRGWCKDCGNLISRKRLKEWRNKNPQLLKNQRKSAYRKQKQNGVARMRKQKMIKELPDCYIKVLLRNQGWPKWAVSDPRLINLTRNLLIEKRAIKSTNNEKEVQKAKKPK